MLTETGKSLENKEIPEKNWDLFHVFSTSEKEYEVKEPL